MLLTWSKDEFPDVYIRMDVLWLADVIKASQGASRLTARQRSSELAEGAFVHVSTSQNPRVGLCSGAVWISDMLYELNECMILATL